MFSARLINGLVLLSWECRPNSYLKASVLPVFSRENQRILFVHIPKTAGSSVENYFVSCGWSVEYLDRSNAARFESPNNYRTVSPQHMHALILSETFEMSKFNLIFTIVRDPIERFQSEFAYRNPGLSGAEFSEKYVEDWWFAQKHMLSRNPHHLDNHLRPQKDFLLPEMKIFRFDSDLPKVKLLADSSFPSLEEIAPKENSLHLPRDGASWNKDRPTPLSRKLRWELTRFYRQDFRMMQKLKESDLVKDDGQHY